MFYVHAGPLVGRLSIGGSVEWLVGCAFIKDKGKQYFTRGDILSLCLCLSNILSQNRVSCQGFLVGFSPYVFDNFNGF